MTRVENKVKQLHHLHKRHLARPTLDDDVSQEEAEIQSQTKEVTEVVTSPQSRKKKSLGIYTPFLDVFRMS